MSDEMAAKVEAENLAQKTAEQLATEQAQAAQQKRLWMVMLILDPETGEFAMQPNANVQKQWQLDTLVYQAMKQGELSANAKVVGGLISKVMETKKGKRLFGL